MNTPILVIDNYDSFTYNLVHYIEKYSSSEVHVYRNDEISLSQIDSYQNIILSPGPGLPKDAGIICELIRQFADKKNILGICLGHQAIAEVFGAKLYNLKEVYHGVQHNVVVVEDSALTANIKSPFKAGRYHSWAVDATALPNNIAVLMQDENKVIMGIKIKNLNVYGLQFHPESIMTECGEKLIENWLYSCK
jgi:anthranilate synthase component II